MASHNCSNLASPRKRMSSRSALPAVARSMSSSSGWIGSNAVGHLRSGAMSGLYEELKDQLGQEKGVALATVVRGAEHVGAKLLVFPNKMAHGTLGLTAL